MSMVQVSNAYVDNTVGVARHTYHDSRGDIHIAQTSECVHHLASHQKGRWYVSLKSIDLPPCFSSCEAIYVTCIAVKSSGDNLSGLIASVRPPVCQDVQEGSTLCDFFTCRVALNASINRDTFYFRLVNHHGKSITQNVSNEDLAKITAVFQFEYEPYPDVEQ